MNPKKNTSCLVFWSMQLDGITVLVTKKSLRGHFFGVLWINRHKEIIKCAPGHPVWQNSERAKQTQSDKAVGSDKSVFAILRISGARSFFEDLSDYVSDKTLCSCVHTQESWCAWQMDKGLLLQRMDKAFTARSHSEPAECMQCICCLSRFIQLDMTHMHSCHVSMSSYKRCRTIYNMSGAKVFKVMTSHFRPKRKEHDQLNNNKHLLKDVWGPACWPWTVVLANIDPHVCDCRRLLFQLRSKSSQGGISPWLPLGSDVQ